MTDRAGPVRDTFGGIEACVFDAYGTLFDVHSAVARGGADLGDRAGAVSDLWRRKQLEYTWLRSLMQVHADFRQVTGEALDFALCAHGVDDTALRDRLMDLYLALEPYPEAARAIARLKEAGLRTAVLSNGSPDMLEAALRSSGLAADLDKVLSVEEVGVYKPDARVYRLAVDRLGVAPASICFLTSNGWDAAGAAHFGFGVAWVNRFSAPWERLPARPHAVIATLEELPALLGL